MKVSLKKNAPFRIHYYPWIVYGTVSFLSVLLLVVKQIILPELLTFPFAPIVILAGIGAGLLYAFYVRKKITGKRNYLTVKQGMSVAWCVSLLGMLLTAFPHWTYLMCVFIVMMNVSFFARYLPRYIEIRDYLSKL